ncbi:MAG: amino acid ABC transporter ATP-binding protein [Deltaproteobacteria bacterium]|jgi:polar amino acid transport system ATP-binding protein|nr:amino acid ABC transporter ATP-binding protein [Deltaproteobacteria bacterium]
MLSGQVVLKIKDLVKNYDQRAVLKGLTLTVSQGEVLVVIGPSGCGKSTLLRCLNGLEPVNGGQIIFEGQYLTDPQTNWSRIRQRVGMVFQNYELFPHLTALENILLGPIKVQNKSREEALAKAEYWLNRVDLWDRRHSFPRQLSGGQKQRVAIVRALAMDPEIMLFDEVTASLDPEMVREVLDVITNLAQEGLTMLIVTHEMAFARAVADRIIFLDDGGIVEDSTPDVFFQNPATERARRFLNIFHYDDIHKPNGSLNLAKNNL